MMTITVNVVRVLVVASTLCVAVLCVGLTGILAVSGYIVYCVGYTKGALAVWAVACCPLVLIGIVVTMVPDWLRARVANG